MSVLTDILDDHKQFIEATAIRAAMVIPEKRWVKTLQLLPHDVRHSMSPNVFACKYISQMQFLCPLGRYTMTRMGLDKAYEIGLQLHFSEKIHAAASNFFLASCDILYERHNPSQIDGVNHRFGGLLTEAADLYSVIEINQKSLSLTEEDEDFLYKLQKTKY